MKQILQSLNNGDINVCEVPCPKTSKNNLLIKTHRSLISSGTERMLLDFGKANFFSKAKQQPEKVREVFNKIKTDGLSATIKAVRSKLDKPLPLGYCNVGTVIEVGESVAGFRVGDRVVSNGHHAQLISVSQNLCVKVPEQVADEDAVMAVMGAIALQGIRLAQPTLGECFAVIGLGLIGLVTVQLLRAQGCRVIGLDFNKEKLALAERFGAEIINLNEGSDPLVMTQKFSRGRGIDGVMITASTSSNTPIEQAAKMCRKRGRVILVGVTGLKLSRSLFYEKEIAFQVSCSYGPGRYDAAYENRGQDYPYPYVRWTAQRNIEAVLDMMEDSRIEVSPLISHGFPIEDANQAYELLLSDKPSLGIVLTYPEDHKDSLSRNVSVNKPTKKLKESQAVVSFIGAGNYATSQLIPAFLSSNAQLKTVVSEGGGSAQYAAKKFTFESASTDINTVFEDSETEVVVIATRHNTHAELVCQALVAGKHVFVEKPLAITKDQLQSIKKSYESSQNACLMVGFNRRFAPQIQVIKNYLEKNTLPKTFVMTVNAGQIPADHWTQDINIGGGRIIGEACHFVDLLRYLAGSQIASINTSQLQNTQNADTVTITLNFSDGSMGTIHYFANGHKSFPKERLEIFVGGSIIQLDNFRKLRAVGCKGLKSSKRYRQDKGQAACVSAFVKAIKEGRAAPIPFEELVEVAEACLEVVEALK